MGTSAPNASGKHAPPDVYSAFVYSGVSLESHNEKVIWNSSLHTGRCIDTAKKANSFTTNNRVTYVLFRTDDENRQTTGGGRSSHEVVRIVTEVI